jgi:hypothetical protein
MPTTELVAPPEWWQPEDPLYRAIMQLVVSVEQEHPRDLQLMMTTKIRRLMPGPFQVNPRH